MAMASSIISRTSSSKSSSSSSSSKKRNKKVEKVEVQNERVRRKPGLDVGRVYTETGEEKYVVEKIIRKEMVDGKMHYRIKWVGWDSKYNTWEPLEHLEDCQELLDEFEAKLKGNSAKAKAKGKGRPSKRDKEPELVVIDSEAESASVHGSLCSDHKNFDHHSESDFSVSSSDVNEKDDKQRERDRKLFSPLFRRVLDDSEVPLCILGSTIRAGVLLHHVRLRPTNEEEVAAVIKDPYDGVNEHNSVIVLADYFNEKFPQMVIQYYADNTTLVRNVKDSRAVAEGAAKAKLYDYFKEVGLVSHANKFMKELNKDYRKKVEGTKTGTETIPINMDEDVLDGIAPLFDDDTEVGRVNGTSKFDQFRLPADVNQVSDESLYDSSDLEEIEDI